MGKISTYSGKINTWLFEQEKNENIKEEEQQQEGEEEEEGGRGSGGGEEEDGYVEGEAGENV